MTRLTLLRVGVTGAALALLATRIDLVALRRELGDLQPGWLLVALALSVPQVVISAWRWRLTARRLGLALPLAAAVREYYLATFVNQVLPGGVLGDAHRAWRHAATADDRAAAAHAVMIERLSGQLALAAVALVALLWAPALRGALASAFADHALAIAAVAVAAGIPFGLAVRRYQTLRRPLAIFARRAYTALLTPPDRGAQFAGSLAVVASYIGVFLCCAQALGTATPAGALWPLIPPVLFAMAVPLSVGGWGLREGAAALLWSTAGLQAHEGVAISLAYGAVVLASSLPGAAVALGAAPRWRPA